ncbi:hypothetical protein TYRP_005066 [Tyrophagus putrescentiae]|nr:hypothetical protein TYRP_005066 [Tyrophagus putrescentiae]
MLFPVRCWTCGKVIGHLWEPFDEAVSRRQMSGEDVESLEPLFHELGIKRFCCFTMFLSHYKKYEQAIQMGFPEDVVPD